MNRQRRPRRFSPETARIAFMLVLSAVAVGISTFGLATMTGPSTPRVLMAVVVAGWVFLLSHSVAWLRDSIRA
jgi:hypothetical protein